MRYDAILFDYDGTVADSLPDIVFSVNVAMRQYGLPEYDAETLAPLLGYGAHVLMEKAVPPGTSDELKEKLYTAYVSYYAAHANDRTVPYPGILPMMRRLREAGLKLAVISNKPDAAVQPGAAKLFSGLLSLAVGERPEVRRKPWPDMVQTAAKNLGVALGRCLYVGDTEVDIDTARNAGIDCVCVTWGFRTREELKAAGGTVIIDRPDELAAYVEKC